MTAAEDLFSVYMPIFFGITLIIFNKLITAAYEKIAERDGSAFPRFITSTRLILGGAITIVFGVVNLIEAMG